MTKEEAKNIRKMVREHPVDIDELKTLSLISILADRVGQTEVSARAKLIINETLSHIAKA